MALREGQIQVVQSSMLGSILSNLLLVMGMCFFLGGIVNMRDADGNGVEQSFASATAQTTCSLMALSSASMIIPSTVSYHPTSCMASVISRFVADTVTNHYQLYTVLDRADEHDKEDTILLLSRGTALILLLLYILYLYFQLRTHTNLFNIEIGPGSESDESEGDGADDATMSPWSAGAVLIATTIVIAVCAEYLVDSIDALVETAHISKNFIGLILIPIVGNAAEHVTACVVAVRNKMDLVSTAQLGDFFWMKVH